VGANGLTQREEGLMAVIGETTDAHEQEITKLREGLAEANSLIAKLTVVVSELKAAHAETRAKADTTEFVVENIREVNKGDPGPRGLMGRDGALGPRGDQGPRGPRGERGERVVSFELHPQDFLIYPIDENGKRGAVLNLRPFFAEYHEQAGAEEETNEIELATAQTDFERAHLELEIERTKRGLPAKR
jgi:hypothetical protein